MGVSYSPSVVRDGLVLFLDAGNVKSYPGSGTTWTDLTGGGSNGTLTNGPTFNTDNKGSIVFDGTNDYVSVSGSRTVTSATFIVWVKRNGNQDQYDGLLISRGTVLTGMNLQSGNQLGYSWNDAGNTWGWSSSLVLPNLSWCMCAISVTSSSAVAYLFQSTGLTTSTNTVSHGSTTIDSLRIGQDNIVTRYFNGNISQALIYNKALSASELQQNFNATRGRFGI